MPRRNRNASTRPASTELDGQLAELEIRHHDTSRVAVPCVACRANPATTGDYCALCKGRITLSARRTTLRRR